MRKYKNNKVQQAFEEMAEALDRDYDTSNDPGHENLINDLKDLMIEAAAYEYYDFKNQNHAAPKIELYKKLLELSENVKNGRYDN